MIIKFYFEEGSFNTRIQYDDEEFFLNFEDRDNFQTFKKLLTEVHKSSILHQPLRMLEDLGEKDESNF